MRPLKVEFQAFGPYAGYEVVDFQAISEKGLFLICGKTGTGKTMILDAITFALYGKSSGHGRDEFEAMRCTKADPDVTTFVKFEFENNGTCYRFERRLEKKRKNFSAAYNVECTDSSGIWHPLFENAKEKLLNEKAIEIIGLEYEQFRQVIVLPQGQFEKLLTSTSDEKEKILTSIFGERRWQGIADKLYEEASARKEALKTIRERIETSLNEEQCDSMEQLYLVIAQKKNQVAILEENYELGEYDKKIRIEQERLSLAKRFGDLRKALDRVMELEKQNDDILLKEAKLQNAERAGKVAELLMQEEASARALNNREQQVKAAVDNAEKKSVLAKRALEELNLHIKGLENIDKKKALKIEYEGKRSDYERIDETSRELQSKKTAENTAKENERFAKEKYDKYTVLTHELQEEIQALNREYEAMLNQYLAGIKGELAATLIEGQECPVCGSKTHPSPAVRITGSVTKEMVDSKSKENLEKQEALQKLLGEWEDAKHNLDKLHAEAEKKHAEVIAVEATINTLSKKTVEGINSLAELNGVIIEIDKEITIFEDTQRNLEQQEKNAREAYTQVMAQIEPAKQECLDAETLYKESLEAVDIGLAQNSFSSKEEAKAMLLDDGDIERLRNTIADYKAKVKSAHEVCEELQKELDGVDAPDESECQFRMKEAQDAKAEFVKNKGIIEAEIDRLGNKAKKLEEDGEGMEEKIREAEEDFSFAKKLRGDSGTGLQRYVLGIMFSSVVTAANAMLSKVHGGRYRLFRSDDRAQGTNKKGLELKVFDQKSENHEGRFVSTLSGGEKFLASLALSIGMSTVAQKSGIKIEALFIDEGFGSLDEDSIEDAMDILESIREANGLVGIISHVQILQDRISSKLKVTEVDNGSHIVTSIG